MHRSAIAVCLLVACARTAVTPTPTPVAPPPIIPSQPVSQVLARYEVGDNTTVDIAVAGLGEEARRVCAALIERGTKRPLPKPLTTRMVRDCRAELLPVIHAPFLLVDTRGLDVLEDAALARPDGQPPPAVTITQTSRYDTEIACRRVERLLADEAVKNRAEAAQMTTAFIDHQKQLADRAVKDTCDRAAAAPACASRSDAWERQQCQSTVDDLARQCREARDRAQSLADAQQREAERQRQPPPLASPTCRRG